MKIAICGATGFIGRKLSKYLEVNRYQIIPLNRETINNPEKLKTIIASCDVVINLAGESIAQRWTKSYRKSIYDSRIITTRKIVNAINSNNHTKLLINTSAIGYYPSDKCVDEETISNDNQFLSSLCRDWENEAHKVRSDVRVAITRFGVVFDNSGGAYKDIARFVEMGVAVIIGNGKQPFSWIGLTDLSRAIIHIIKNEKLNGVFNFTVPQSNTQSEIINAMCKYYGTKLKIHIPSSVLYLMLGEASQIMTTGKCVLPKRLKESHFQYETPTIEDFLKAIK